jgi:predicted phosphodiesterase
MSKKDFGNHLFSFAVLADTHLNQNDIDCNSPFDVNRRANRRLRYVIEDLNQRDIDLVLHLGDVVHPVPSMGDLYADSSARFFEQTKNLRHPLHLIPGNHDVGDKKFDWGPAGTVRDDFLAAWSKYFGEHYFHIAHKEIHFIGINIQLVGSGLDMEAEQKIWLEQKLRTLNGERVFLCSHYPPFLLDKDEAEHYDNLGEVGRKWMLDLMAKHQVEAMFAGHVHHFWYNRSGATRCYLLPSTAFTRQDYSEMFRVSPSTENGRNDAEKLGYLIMHVYERGHAMEMVRSFGLERDEGYSIENGQCFKKSHQFLVDGGALGFDLRQDWCETVQIPPSGGLDEFDRKSVRNDYGLLALIEMGVRRIRLPITDLLLESRLQRLQDLLEFGFRFTFFSFDIPGSNVCQVIDQNPGLITAWELTLSSSENIATNSLFFTLCKQQGIKLYYSPLRSKEDILASGKKYYHVINHGYSTNDDVNSRWNDQLSEIFQGVVYRLGIDESVSSVAQAADLLYTQTNLLSSIHLRLAGDNPAETVDDQANLCNRLAAAIILGAGSSNAQFYCDTLADNDRGYFPRSGVVDRLYNPKAGMRVVQNLMALMSESTSDNIVELALIEDGQMFDISSDTQQRCVLIFDKELSFENIDPAINAQYGSDSKWQVIHLAETELDKIRAIENNERNLRFRSPLLITFF